MKYMQNRECTYGNTVIVCNLSLQMQSERSKTLYSKLQNLPGRLLPADHSVKGGSDTNLT